jgi:hypothetical protein
MTENKPPKEINRSFPEAREFLLSKIVGPNYPVKHLIEQARNKGHITKGKPGRGGGVVTSQDMAMLLTATLAGDTPQEASDALSILTSLTPPPDLAQSDNVTVNNLGDSWWNGTFTDVIAYLIDAWRQNIHLGFDEMTFSVNRSPIFFGSIIWNDIPYEQDLQINYYAHNKKNLITGGNLRRISVSFDGETLRQVADWLEGREGH